MGRKHTIHVIAKKDIIARAEPLDGLGGDLPQYLVPSGTTGLLVEYGPSASKRSRGLRVAWSTAYRLPADASYHVESVEGIELDCSYDSRIEIDWTPRPVGPTTNVAADCEADQPANHATEDDHAAHGMHCKRAIECLYQIADLLEKLSGPCEKLSESIRHLI